MAKHRVGAIAAYKAAVRKIKRDRAQGITATAGIPSSVRPTLQRSSLGEWFVWVRGQQVAGPFNTREEAQEWIDDGPETVA
jgi:hypothetical protein